MTPEKAKEIREKLGLNQKQMMKLLGIKRSQINSYENGRTSISKQSENLYKFYNEYWDKFNDLPDFIKKERNEQNLNKYKLVKSYLGWSCEGCCFNVGRCIANDEFINLCKKGCIWRIQPD